MAIAQIARYHEPDQTYRGGMPNLIYRDFFTPDTNLAGFPQPHRRAITVRIYDQNDKLVEMLSSNSGICPIVSCSFDVTNNGCDMFDLVLSRQFDIDHDYRVDIHLWNDPLPWYCGFVFEPTPPGTTDRTFSYAGFGGVALLDRLLVTDTYEHQAVHLIARALAKEAEKRTRIIYDESQIQLSRFSTVGELKFLRTPFKDAMKQVADLAGGYEWGVDERRRFFFRKPPTSTATHSWVGRHLNTYVPREDSKNIVNSMMVKAGKVRTDLPSDNPFYKTNWVADPLQDIASQRRYGIREGVYQAPSMYSLIDAVRAAAVELKRKKDPERSAKVSGFIFQGEREFLTPGQARIIGRGGVEMTLPKKKVTFRLTGTKCTVSAELGQLDRANTKTTAELAAKLAAENLARQQSQNQL